MANRPYLVSQGKEFHMMVYAKGPKEAVTRIANFRDGKGNIELRLTQKELPSTYKIVLACSEKTSITFYDVMRKPQ